MKRSKNQDVFAAQPGKAALDARQLRKQAGDWLKLRRADAGLSRRRHPALMDGISPLTLRNPA